MYHDLKFQKTRSRLKKFFTKHMNEAENNKICDFPFIQVSTGKSWFSVIFERFAKSGLFAKSRIISKWI